MARPATLALALLALLGCREGVGCGARGKRFVRENALRHDLLVLRKSIDDFHQDKQRYPKTVAELVSEKYLRATPKDPFTRRADSWIEARTSGGVYDVRSSAPGVACDGTPYGNL